MSISSLFTSCKVLLSALEVIGPSSIPPGSYFFMADTYIWNIWIMFSSWYSLNLNLQIGLFPLGGESGIYLGVTRPWADVAYAYPVHHLVSGMYNQRLGKSKFL